MTDREQLESIIREIVFSEEFLRELAETVFSVPIASLRPVSNKDLYGINKITTSEVGE